MFLLLRLVAFTVILQCFTLLSCGGLVGIELSSRLSHFFSPEALSDDSPDVRNAIAGLDECYGLAFSSCLNVRAISFSLLF